MGANGVSDFHDTLAVITVSRIMKCDGVTTYTLFDARDPKTNIGHDG